MRWRWQHLTWLLLLAGPPARAQFVIRVQQDANVVQVANNTTLPLTAPAAGKSASLKILVTYQGTGTASFTRGAQFLGPGSFTISGPPAGTTIAPNGTVITDVVYTAANSKAALGQLDLAFNETIPSQPPTISTGMITLGLAGSAPEFTLSYLRASDSNIVQLLAGEELPFPETVVNTTSTAQTFVLNRGSGAGELTQIFTTGEAFETAGLPLFPGNLASGGSLSFTVRYRPRQAGPSQGTLVAVFGETSYTVRLSGSGVTSVFSYQVETSAAPRDIFPGDTIELPDTAPGETGRVTMRIRAGATEAVLAASSFELRGDAFRIADLPFLPTTIAPGGSRIFALVFAPTEPGTAAGLLRIGADTFELKGRAVGPQLRFTFQGSTIVGEGSANFGPVAVGASSTAEFAIRNTGTAAAVLANIVMGETGSVFTLEGLPAFPLRIAPAEQARFTIRFAPAATGLAAGTLRVDSQTFTLSGSGTTPPPLPSYSIEGADGVQQPLQQPAIGLTLASPYPMALTGTLTIRVESDAFAADPSVQFSSGGQTATFRIPANSTRAQFANGATTLRLQTGTVAGTIILTPTFFTLAGLNLTPENPTALRLTVGASAPRLQSLQLPAISATGFTVQVSGFTTTRTLTKLDFQFTTASGFNVAGTSFSVDISSAAGDYFRNSASQGFGGQFTATVPFTLGVRDGTEDSPVNALDSVTVTATNDRGTSGAVTVKFR